MKWLKELVKLTDQIVPLKPQSDNPKLNGSSWTDLLTEILPI